MKIIWFLIIAIILTTLLVNIIIAVNKSKKISIQKIKEFECGFNRISNTRLPFSSQFFIISILFLIFDLEISIIIPIALEESKNITSFLIIMILISILTVALIIEWIKGIIEWTK